MFRARPTTPPPSERREEHSLDVSAPHDAAWELFEQLRADTLSLSPSVDDDDQAAIAWRSAPAYRAQG